MTTLDETRRSDIWKRMQEGQYVSPAEKGSISQDMTSSGGGGGSFYGAPAVDALATNLSGFGISRALNNLPYGAGAIAGGASSLIGDLASGKPVDKAFEAAGINAGKGAIREAAMLGGGAIGGIGGAAGGRIIGSTLSEMLSPNPDYKRAAVSSSLTTPISILGGIIWGPIGALAAGFGGGALVENSLSEGWLGDVFDTRNLEGYRDRLEDTHGYGLGGDIFENFSSLGAGTQLSLLEGGFGPESTPSYSTLHENVTGESLGEAVAGLLGTGMRDSGMGRVTGYGNTIGNRLGSVSRGGGGQESGRGYGGGYNESGDFDGGYDGGMSGYSDSDNDRLD